MKPKDGSKGAKVTAKVKVVASEALAPGSVTKRTVVLKQKGVGKVKVKVTYVAARHVIKLTPKSPLDPDATYVVTGQGCQGRGREHVGPEARQGRRATAEVLLHHRLSTGLTPTGRDARPVGAAPS